MSLSFGKDRFQIENTVSGYIIPREYKLWRGWRLALLIQSIWSIYNGQECAIHASQ